MGVMVRNMPGRRLLVIGGIILILITGCRTLKDLRISVPLAVVRGKNATLRCTYDLESDALYSVKWYRGEREFFRYTPNDIPHIKQFAIPGLEVVEEESNDKQITVRAFYKNISGPFTCEVTADQPSFLTEMQTAPLEVVDLPTTGPTINGLKQRYKPGDILRAECTSGDSSPAANLTWFLNDQPVDLKHVTKLKPTSSKNGLTARSVLRIHLQPSLIIEGRVRVRCVATVHDLYIRSSERTVYTNRRHRHRPTTPPHNVHVAGEGLGHATGYSGYGFATRDEKNALRTTTEEPVPWQWEYGGQRPPPDTTLVFSPINSMASIFNKGRVAYKSMPLLLLLLFALFVR